MKFKLLNSILATVIIVGILIFSYKPTQARHEQWHEGPSCGVCHCQKDQECSADGDGGCKCEDDLEEKKLQIN